MGVNYEYVVNDSFTLGKSLLEFSWFPVVLFRCFPKFLILCFPRFAFLCFQTFSILCFLGIRKRGGIDAPDVWLLLFSKILKTVNGVLLYSKQVWLQARKETGNGVGERADHFKKVYEIIPPLPFFYQCHLSWEQRQRHFVQAKKEIYRSVADEYRASRTRQFFFNELNVCYSTRRLPSSAKRVLSLLD